MDEVILTSNKGNVTVMMRCDYDVKMEEMLGTDTDGKLSTNVPVGEAISVIRERLRKDETLQDRTPLSPDLLEMCLKSTSLEGNFYEQKGGVAMGSPVSAAVTLHGIL